MGEVNKGKHKTRAGHAGVEGLQLVEVPVAQLLLELAALLYSCGEMWLAGHGALLCVLEVADRLAPEQLVTFCEGAGALLLQVLWLDEQLEHDKHQDTEGMRQTKRAMRPERLVMVVATFAGGLCSRLLTKTLNLTTNWILERH
jgi:hypothetical protein